MSDLLDVKNVSISFTQYVKGLNQIDLKVITDLTLNIKEGEIVAVLGSSGSGKSLLAHAILGILPHNANLNGEISYKGQLLDEKLKEKYRGNGISLIPQSVNFLDPLMKISKQVIGECKSESEFLEKKKKQEEIFEKYGLSKEVEDMYPFQLSGGMARRVLVSTALLSNPDLVIADEPTPGLDEKSVKETLRNLKTMAESGVGILLITHDIHAAIEVADRIGIFYAGFVIEITKTENFRGNGENLYHPYTKALFNALPKNGFKLTKGHQPLHGEIPKGCPYFKNCPNPLEICDKKRPQLREYEDIKVRCFRYMEDY